MSRKASTFELDLKTFAEKVGATLDEAARGIKIALFSGVIRDTRVDTGRMRGNWQTSTGSPVMTAIDRLDQIPQGADGGGAMSEVLSTVQGDTIDYISNNVVYAPIWEERDGMIARNLSRISRIVSEEVAKVRR